jgi:hypothetical protein
MCEALGLDVWGQAKRLKAQAWACTSMTEVHDSSGREQEMFCLALRSVPMWLAGIQSSRVGPEAREKLIRYQCEAAGGRETSPRTRASG